MSSVARGWSAIPIGPRRSIARLQHVRRITLYGSRLVRVPPEIAELPNLEMLDTYTSYGLHWYPYELTRCPTLHDSRLSTRTVYGNFKNRMTFPRLGLREAVDPRWADTVTRPCSVCEAEFVDRGEQRVWINLRVATDVMALLVNACSQACIDALPASADGYVSGPHRGGPELAQPDPR